MRAQSVRLIAGREMLSDYTQTERICFRLELERDCLRMTVGPGSLYLRQIQDVHLRRLSMQENDCPKLNANSWR